MKQQTTLYKIAYNSCDKVLCHTTQKERQRNSKMEYINKYASMIPVRHYYRICERTTHILPSIITIRVKIFTTIKAYAIQFKKGQLTSKMEYMKSVSMMPARHYNIFWKPHILPHPSISALIASTLFFHASTIVGPIFLQASIQSLNGWSKIPNTISYVSTTLRRYFPHL